MHGHSIDSHAADQHHDGKEQIHAQQLDQERSTHKMHHSQYSSVSSVCLGQHMLRPKSRINIHALYYFGYPVILQLETSSLLYLCECCPRSLDETARSPPASPAPDRSLQPPLLPLPAT